MDVLVTGAGGFIGSALVPALRAGGHRPIVAVRARSVPAKVDGIVWDPVAGRIDAAALEGIGAVVHLAGAGIGDRRWSDKRKRVILDSRTKGTRLLADTLAQLDRKPSVFVSASAIGYYGDRGDEILTEQSTSGNDFLADVCRRWEESTAPAVDADIRVVTIRTGIVLGRGGGILGRVLLPFRLGLGGRTGWGVQYLSWITLHDEIRAIVHAIDTAALRGPVNLVAPNPAMNAEFAKLLGRILHRPAVLPTPIAPLRVLMGRELVDALMVASQRVRPAALDASGFTFEHPTLEEGLRSVLNRQQAHLRCLKKWGDRGESNPRPPGSQPGALTD